MNRIQKFQLPLIIILVGLTIPAVCWGEERTEYLYESFEGLFPPSGWAIATTGEASTWRQTDYSPRTGVFCAAVYYGGASQWQDEWLITPALNTTGADELYLEFYERGQYWHPLYGDHHYIMVSTTSQTDPAAFTTLLDMTPADHVINGFDGEPLVVDLSNFLDEETLYIALRYTGSAADIWWVDDLRIFSPTSHDVKAMSIAPLHEHFNHGDPLVATATYRNLGPSAESFSVLCEISESGLNVFSETAQVTDLPPGEDASVEFPTHIVNGGNYLEVTCTSQLAGDTDPGNDSISALNYSYTNQRVPYGMMVTNWSCSGCPQANQALDDYLVDQGDDVAVLRVHGWWPGGGDPMFLANIEQNTWLVEDTPFGSDYAPHLWLDGIFDGGGDGATFAGHFEGRKLVGSPLEIETDYDTDNSRLHVIVRVLEPLHPAGEYKLHTAITEDDIYAVGGNGETTHHQVFRYMYPDVHGLPVPATLGEHEFFVDTPLDGGWVFDNLRGTVYVRELNSKLVLNAATGMLREGGTATGDNLPLPATGLRGVYPNPFNPTTTVSLVLDRDQKIELAVHDTQGRLVIVLADGQYSAGEHLVPWDGRDDLGRRVVSGLYFIRLKSQGGVESRKMVLLK